jgi:hypothetical protein
MAGVSEAPFRRLSPFRGRRGGIDSLVVRVSLGIERVLAEMR